MGRSPQICTVSYSVTSNNVLLIPKSWSKILKIVISLCQNNNKKHAVPPPRLFCPKVGKPEKSGMSHCTALLKNYRLGLFKDKKEMKFVQNSFAKVFFYHKNAYDNPQISWRYYVALYGTGPLSHCTAFAVF